MTNRYLDSAFPYIVRIEGPCTNPYTGGFVARGDVVVQIDHGMTLRDYFAAKAMQALIQVQVQTKQVQTAETAYEWADAMLKERQK